MTLIDLIRQKMFNRPPIAVPKQKKVRSVVMSDELPKKEVGSKAPFHSQDVDLTREAMRRDGLRKKEEAILRSRYNWNKPSRLCKVPTNEFD